MKCYCGKYEATTGGFDTQGKHNLAGCESNQKAAPTIWTTNGDHLWRGHNNGQSAAFDDCENPADIDNYTVEVVKPEAYRELKAENEQLKKDSFATTRETLIKAKRRFIEQNKSNDFMIIDSLINEFDAVSTCEKLEEKLAIAVEALQYIVDSRAMSVTNDPIRVCHRALEKIGE